MLSEYLYQKQSEQLKTWSEDIPDEILVSSNLSPLLGEMPEICKKPIVDGKEVYVLESFFSREESERFIEATEVYGYGKTDFAKHYRGNLRLRCNDIELAEALFERVKPFIPLELTENHGGEDLVFEAVGLNPLFRFSKYLPGDVFKPHVDAAFKAPLEADRKIKKSMYTINLYLNGDFDAGATRFFVSRSDMVEEGRVVPVSGRCLLFRQPPHAHYLHDGEEVKASSSSPPGRGIKYLLRSDVVYVSKTPSTVFEADPSTIADRPRPRSLVEYTVYIVRSMMSLVFPTWGQFPRN